MIGNVPPVITSPKSLINVGKRETVILGIGAIGTMGVFFFPISAILKVGLAVIVAGFAAALALGRDPKSGKNVEQYLLVLIGFARRIKLHQRGAQDVDLLNIDDQLQQQKALSKEKISTKPLTLGFLLFLQIMSMSFMAMLLTWIWSGGLEEYLKQFNTMF